MTHDARPAGRKFARWRHLAVQNIGNAVSCRLAGPSGDEHCIHIAQDGIQGSKGRGTSVDENYNNLSHLAGG
jgi:hypothetical protein